MTLPSFPLVVFDVSQPSPSCRVTSGLQISDFAGTFHPVFPFFGYVSCDWPESKLYNLTRDGNKTACPCGTCLCPKDRLFELATFFQLRTIQETRYLVERAMSMGKTQGNAFLKPYSLKAEEVRLGG